MLFAEGNWKKLKWLNAESLNILSFNQLVCVSNPGTETSYTSSLICNAMHSVCVYNSGIFLYWHHKFISSNEELAINKTNYKAKSESTLKINVP